MSENSKIEWTDHTFNPWIGCTKVSPGCDHCYAETWAKRYGTAEWGTGQPRHLTSESNWRQPLKWNREAAASGVRKRVFCASLADVFDNEVPEEWRVRLWKLIYDTPHLDWLLLTKRIGNARHMLPLGVFREGPLANLWLGISVVNQQEADRDIPKLLALPVRIRFLSMEPLLGPVDLSEINGERVLDPECWGDCACDALYGFDTGCRRNGGDGSLTRKIDWVIVGGESGKDARPMHPEWAQSLRDQCVTAGVPFFFKQWGEWKLGSDFAADAKAVLNDGTVAEPTLKALKLLDAEQPVPPRHPEMMRRVGKKASGRLLDGREWNQFPEVGA